MTDAGGRNGQSKDPGGPRGQTGVVLEENSIPFGFSKILTAQCFPRQNEPLENWSLWLQKM